MSLFVDLRQIKSSVTNVSEIVDKVSTSTDKENIRCLHQTEEPVLYRNSIFKPTLGLGVRFSHSQEDVYQNMPSSRLRSHMSLPNLGEEETLKQLRNESRPIIKEIDEERNDLKPIIQTSTENISQWIVAVTNKRPYFDDSSQTHPMDFIEDVKFYVTELSMAPEKQLRFVISCLSGVPLMWARCFKREFKDMESFFSEFEQEFWGRDRQKSVLYDMKLGKYDVSNSTISMSEYFLHKVSNYRHLTPPPSDLEIVYSLAAHFDTAIELELRLSPRPSLREAYRVLRRREGDAADFMPNYLYEMCEAFQRGQKPESARR